MNKEEAAFVSSLLFDTRYPCVLPLIVLAAATIYFGIDTEWTAGIASTAAKVLLGGLR